VSVEQVSPQVGLVHVRRARTSDVPGIEGLVTRYAAERILLAKERVTLYEDIQEFQVGQAPDGTIVGCGALHVLWEDLAEVRTIAVDRDWRGHGIGHAILAGLVDQAREIGVSRLFCLTFEVDFFAGHGFRAIDGTPVEPAVYAQLLRSMDEGVAEFLDLARVKPNTLGNIRMLRKL
jgi:amino-acid N-acetyltransferase